MFFSHQRESAMNPLRYTPPGLRNMNRYLESSLKLEQLYWDPSKNPQVCPGRHHFERSDVTTREHFGSLRKTIEVEGKFVLWFEFSSANPDLCCEMSKKDWEP